MSVAKVIEIISASNTSFDDAIKRGIEKASETVSGIAGAWVKDQNVDVEDGKIKKFRVTLKITFVLEGSSKHKGKSK